MKTVEATTESTAPVATQGASVAPEKAPSKKDPTKKKGAPKSQKAAKGGKAKALAQKKEAAKASKKAAAKPARTKEAAAPRAESKGAKVLELIGRPKGATLGELMTATDWQRHSIRGYLSTAAKNRGLKIESTKNEAGDRVYQAK